MLKTLPIPIPQKGFTMGAQENKQVAEDAYRAFGNGDAAGAMENMDDAIVWTVRGDNALTGTYTGKQEIGELWGKLVGKVFSTDPHDFIAEGNKVIVLTTVTLAGNAVESADVLTYNDAGKLVAFDTLGDPTNANEVFPK
jgi:ketosteroid isomerase-like protein